VNYVAVAREVLTLGEKILVTAALPYANEELHIAHARSTYIPADIYVRYHRLKGSKVIYICGTDEHGTPISVRAEQEGVSPRKVIDKYYARDREDFRRLEISFDNFSRTSRKIHYKTTQEFFLKLLEKGYVYEEKSKLPYCIKCRRFLPDRYVQGICPHCGFPEARGDECDSCGRVLHEGELLEPKCVICKSSTEMRETTHWFLRLSAFQEFLLGWIKNTEGLLPAYGKAFLIRQYLEKPLREICITRDLNWGVPVPLKEAKGKVLYVWFDAPIGYIDSTKEFASKIGKPNEWKKYWLKGDSKLVHFIGKGIIYHHAIFWPSILYGVGYRLPSAIVAFGHGNLEGRKMSKSRGWYVSIKDFLENFESDSLRYYWTISAPLSEDADFSWDEFARRHNDELADILGNFIHRTLIFTLKYFKGKIPAPALQDYDRETLKAINETYVKVTNYIEKFDFHAALKSIMELAALGNKYLNDTQPWTTVKTEPKKAATSIYVSAQIVKALSVLLAPFLPSTANKIWRFLNLKGKVHEQKWSEALKRLPKNQKIRKPQPLFKKIQPELIEAQKMKLYKAKEK
jgi:methionyl-tRNA synthetase